MPPTPIDRFVYVILPRFQALYSCLFFLDRISLGCLFRVGLVKLFEPPRQLPALRSGQPEHHFSRESSAVMCPEGEGEKSRCENLGPNANEAITR